MKNKKNDLLNELEQSNEYLKNIKDNLLTKKDIDIIKQEKYSFRNLFITSISFIGILFIIFGVSKMYNLNNFILIGVFLLIVGFIIALGDGSN